MRRAAAGASTMIEPHRYTANEILTVLSARQLRDGQVVFAGVGVPLLAATLAQRTRCPGLTILFEGGVIGAFVEPGKLPPSTNDQRCTKRANMVLGSAEVLLLLQRGYVDVGFMGGAQIDQFGNLNSSFIGDPAHPKTRLPGTGGGNDISSLANMIVAMKHEKRRFVEHVDFITSPGFISGGDSRAKSGLPTGGMFRVVTELAVFSFEDEERRMKVAALNPGVSREEVQDKTGFELIFDNDLAVTEPPSEPELATLRMLDPERLFTAYPEMPDAKELVDYGVRMEELGFDSIWVWDHILLGVEPNFPVLDSLTTLTAIAARTSKIKLGTGVLVLTLRNPVTLAKQLASMDQLSDGRLLLGMASGWYKREFDAVGIPFEKRGKLMDENLEILRRLWSEEQVNGSYMSHQISKAVMYPKPKQ